MGNFLLTLGIIAVFVGVIIYICRTFRIGKHPVHLSFLYTLFGLLSITVGVLSGVKPFFWAGLTMIAPILLGWLKFAGDKIREDQPEHTPFKDDEILQLHKTEPTPSATSHKASEGSSTYWQRMREHTTKDQTQKPDEQESPQEPEYGEPIKVSFLDNLNQMNEKDADAIAELEKVLRTNI